MKKSSLLVKTFVAFIAFLLLTVIIIGSIFNYGIMKYSESEISKASIGKLKLIRSINDLLVNEITNDALKLSKNTTLNQLDQIMNNSKNGDGGLELIKIKEVMDILSDIVNASEGIHSIYLYLEDYGYVISSKSGVYTVPDFIDTQWIKDYDDHKLKGLGAFWTGGRRPVNSDVVKSNSEEMLKTLGDNDVMSYIYPLTSNVSQLNGAIVINLYEDKLSRLINNNDFNREGFVEIINTNGDVISHVDKNMLMKNLSNEGYVKNIIGNAGNEGYLIDKIGAVRQMITYYKSDTSEWIYVGIFPLDVLNSKVSALRIQLLYVLLGLIALGIAVSYWISKRIYNPLNQLIQDIKNHKGIELVSKESDVSLISKAFNSIISEEKKLMTDQEKNRKRILEKILTELLNGNYAGVENEDIICESIKFPCFICAVIMIDKYVDFCSRYKPEQQYYLKTLIINICHEVVKEEMVIEGVNLNNDLIPIIINIDEGNELQALQSLKQSFLLIQQEVAKVLDNSVTVGIGECYKGLDKICLSYNEAREAASKRIIFGYGNIYCYNKEFVEQSKYYYPFNIEKHIFNNLKAASIEGMRESVRRLTDDIKEHKELSFDNIMLIFNQLLGSTIIYVLDMNLSIMDIMGDDQNIYAKLSSFETIQEIEQWLIVIYEKIIEYVDKQKKASSKYINEVLDYIHMNYKTDIDINALADRIGISYSQLRRAFLNATGENLLDYINYMRINEAKRLLLQTNETIGDIAENLGYNNFRSFIRFFKKYEGITPGDFRKQQIS